MPKDVQEKVAGASGVQVVKFADPANEWKDYGDMPGDRTPGNPIGQHASVFRSPDGRVSVGLWRRDAVLGDLLGSGQCFDFVIEGDVTVTDSEGRKHRATSGDLLIYNESDTGTWEQPGPIRKIFIHVRD
jgi:uncharacterized cupin superfamily protein